MALSTLLIWLVFLAAAIIVLQKFHASRAAKIAMLSVLLLSPLVPLLTQALINMGFTQASVPGGKDGVLFRWALFLVLCMVVLHKYQATRTARLFVLLMFLIPALARGLVHMGFRQASVLDPNQTALWFTVSLVVVWVTDPKKQLRIPVLFGLSAVLLIVTTRPVLDFADGASYNAPTSIHFHGLAGRAFILRGAGRRGASHGRSFPVQEHHAPQGAAG